MSLSKIKNTVENFILRDNNDALAIKGRYGVGKTYFWQNLIRVKSDGKPYYLGITEGKGKDREIGKKHYIYLSLFGVDSLKSLKNNLFAEMVYSKDVASKTNKLSSFSKKVLNKLEDIPHIQKFTGDLVSSITFQDVRDALICFDDLDRKSSGLSITEIIGLANLLKDQHNCKIVLILNEDGFEDEKEKNEFRKQIEKLIDFEINYAPTTEEVIEHVFPPSFPNQEIIKTFCLRLKINNIRILQKIKRYIEELSDFTKSFEREVLLDVFRSLILFVLSHYDKTKNVPTLEEIQKFDVTGFNVNRTLKKEISEKDSKIYEFFREYDFRGLTDFDEELLDFVKNGFINSQRFSEKLKVKNDAIIAQNGVNKYRQAWRLYNNTFECNEKEFIEKLMEGYLANITLLDIRDLTSSIEVLRQLGANKNADKLADEYVKKIFDDEKMLLMRRGHMDFNVEDIYLKQKLNDKLDSQISNRTLKEVLERFSSSNPNYYEDVEFLKSVTEDEFYGYFKSYEPKQVENEIQFYIHDLYNQVMACLDFIDYSDERQTIGINTKRAIVRIALDCPINRSRIINWFKKISEDDIENQKSENGEIANGQNTETE